MKDNIIAFLEGCRNGVLYNIILLPVYVLATSYAILVAGPIFEKILNKLGW